MKHTLETLLALAESDDGRQQIRVIVAELVGAKWWAVHKSASTLSLLNLGVKHGWQECSEPLESSWINDDVPKYETSLDAIMPEVRKLHEKAAEKWANFMADLFYRKGNLGWQVCYAIATAEAIHASIAFILTKQKP